MKFQDIKTIEELKAFAANSNTRTYYTVDSCYPYTVSRVIKPTLFFRFYETSPALHWGDFSLHSNDAHGLAMFDNEQEANEFSKKQKIEYLESELKKIRDNEEQ